MNKVLPIIACMTLSFSLTPAFAAGVGIPNPASQLCLNLGGTLESYVNEEGGAVSLCAFNDDVFLNGLIEEWTLFRYKQEGLGTSLAVKAFFDHVPYEAPTEGPVGHPALRYCEQVGGTRALIIASTGDESGVCQFEDGSQIEEWTLFRGPEVHENLSEVLGSPAQR